MTYTENTCAFYFDLLSMRNLRYKQSLNLQIKMNAPTISIILDGKGIADGFYTSRGSMESEMCSVQLCNYFSESLAHGRGFKNVSSSSPCTILHRSCQQFPSRPSFKGEPNYYNSKIKDELRLPWSCFSVWYKEMKLYHIHSEHRSCFQLSDQGCI